MVEAAGCAEGLVLAEVADGDVGELALGLLDEAGHVGVVVEADDDDFGEAGHVGEGLEGVPDHRLACDGQQGFRACGSQRGAGGSDSQSRVRGRIRVPLEGPPTRMTPLVLGMAGGGGEGELRVTAEMRSIYLAWHKARAYSPALSYPRS